MKKEDIEQPTIMVCVSQTGARLYKARLREGAYCSTIVREGTGSSRGVHARKWQSS